MAGKRKPDANLEAYEAKRRFERTPEPRGGEAAASASGRLFVVQKHAARQLHYDFRLEFDGVLKSWAVPKGPCLDPAQKPLAVHVEDHPLEYASFEGAIPEGEYGAGTVMVWDQGEWEPLGDPVDGYARGDLKFRLVGRKLRGAWVLVRMGGKAAEDGRNWLLIKKKDEEARSLRSYNVLSELPRSVLSGRSMEEIEADPHAVWKDGAAVPTGSAEKGSKKGRRAKAPADALDPSVLPGARKGAEPARLKPQLTTRVGEAPAGDHWLHEIKLDGYRLICHLAGGEVRLLTRNGHDWTGKFERIARAAARLPIRSGVLDGEVVVLDAEGVSDFQALQNAFRGYTSGSFVYYLFDVPYAQGYDLREVPLIERKRFLQSLLQAAPLAAPALQYCDHIVGGGPVVFEQAARAGLEGIISKRVDAAYESRRTESWVKVKCTHSQDFVVGGFTGPSGSRAGFGALLLGYHDPSARLVYCGRVGTGFSDEALERIGKMLVSRLRDDPPFVNPEADPDAAHVHWVEPDLVADVEFGAWTNDGLVRHATFRGLREDVDARDVLREGGAEAIRARPRQRPRKQVEAVVRTPASPQDAFVSGVRISNPDRTVYPDDGVTKLHVAEYYDAIAEWILPHVAKRPLSLVRCPLGLAGESFYQREPGEGFPRELKGIDVPAGDGGDPDHAVVIDGRKGLISLVQMGVLEIHSWGCREDDLEKPDQLIFDLDPGEGIEWEHVVASARFVHDSLRDLGLASFVKTTGGKGLHVVVPIVRRATWDVAKELTKAIADGIVRAAPLNFVATMSKALRANRIFVDYLRNQKGATAVAAYSTRARNGATVSTPLSWEELSPEVGPRAFTVTTVPDRLARLRRDPWEGFREARQSITAGMRRALGSGT